MCPIFGRLLSKTAFSDHMMPQIPRIAAAPWYQGSQAHYFPAAPHGMMVADETCPYVAAQGPTRGKFGQTTSPPVAALVIKLIVSRHMFNIQAHG